MVPLITLSILVYCLACLRPDRDSTFRLLTVTSSFIRGVFGGLPIAPFLNKFGKEMLIFLSLFLLNLSYVVQLFIHVTPFVPSPDNKLTPEILTFTWAQGVGLRLSLVKESKWWNRRSEKSFNWRTTFDPPSSISAKLKNERKILRKVKQEKCFLLLLREDENAFLKNDQTNVFIHLGLHLSTLLSHPFWPLPPILNL